MFDLTRGEEFTALIAVALLGAAIAAVCLLRGDRGRTVEIPLNKSGGVTVQKGGRNPDAKIMVHVSGAVHRDGVLELAVGSRMKDALEVAQPTEDANLEAVNLAAPLVDGERIVVPRKGMATPAGSPPRWTGSSGTVNINTASQEELESLSGIGEVLAKRIIEFRTTAKFERVEDLVRIKGIGPKTIEKLREHVCVR